MAARRPKVPKVVPYPWLEELTFCLETGYPAEVTAAFLALAADSSGTDDLLQAAYRVWNEWGEYRFCESEFVDAVVAVTGDECLFCRDCGTATWWDNTTEVRGCDRVCDERCISDYYSCDSCDGWFDDTTGVSGSYYCSDCLSDNCSYCDDCDEYYHHDDEHGHDCSCPVPRPEFSFPADGYGVIEENQRLTVELPKGTVDDEGIRRIGQLLWSTLADQETYVDVWPLIGEVGPTWQTKRGNFTRRLSSAVYKQYKVKLSPDVISKIGNLARAHSSDAAEWHIEVTRDLNGSPGEFYHDESCWWGGYSASRCALKNWGGLALRSYKNLNAPSYDPNGRAWVQPLNDVHRPTHDTMNAHAYVVFNGYGQLEGYTAARIVAHLTGRTYRKIEFSVEGQYVNNDSGYLVADEATCRDTDRVSYYFDHHDEQDAHTFEKKAAVA